MITIGQEQLHPLLKMINPRLAVGFGTAELVDDAAEAAI